MPEETGKRIGDYQILNELGSGGMGRVYKVRNVLSDRIEAMKILLPNLAGREDIAARFLREIKLMANLNHPNIAALRTAFTGDNQLVMIMEYVEGTDLAARLEHGPIAPADAVNYIQQVLSALSYAHQQHIIHRDIKPSNMMLTPQGVVKLMDFGIARAGEERSITMTGTTLGSLGYMSPEQVKGEPTDARSDLYSVGVSLYEMVTGQRPFQASSDYSIMAAHVKETPKPPVELHPGLPAAHCQGPGTALPDSRRFPQRAEQRAIHSRRIEAHSAGQA
jgi:serine/threonine protein kinase